MRFLKKLFIKNYRDTDNPEVRLRYGRVAGIIGIISNIFLFGIKILIGLLSASITIIVDAINNISDAGTALLTLIGFKLANKPADREHPYGHARYEFIMGLIISIITLTMGIIFAKSCIEKIITPIDLNIDIWTFVILSIAILIKLFQYFMYKSFAKSIDSDTLRANQTDTKLDTISSVTILVSMIVMSIFNINIDGYIGLAVSIYIIICAYIGITNTISPLISEKPEKRLVNKITKELRSFDGINDMHDLLIHTYGSGSTFASVHVEVPASTSLLDIHELVDKIERHFEDKFKINLTIQIDPIDKENPRTQAIYDKVKTTIKSINKKFTIHGLRVIYNVDRVKVLFDIKEDFDTHLKKPEVRQILEKAFSNEKETFEFIFTIDKPII